jgi:hypothetical protein
MALFSLEQAYEKFGQEARKISLCNKLAVLPRVNSINLTIIKDN